MRRFILTLLFFVVSSSGLQASDSLLRPALMSQQVTQSLLLDITQAGDRLVAVGERGHIVFRDPGQSWQQAQVPVIAHLTAVTFATPSLGFAVGHDGIILRSEDAGQTWTLVHHELKAAPERAMALIPEIEEALAQAEEAGDLMDIEWLEMELDDLYFAAEGDEVPPLLAVAFIDDQTGFAVGGYNLLLMTEDAGLTWQSVQDELPNPEMLHNNALLVHPQQVLLIAGERGSLYRSEDQGAYWEKIDLPYDGSLFGLFTSPNGDLFATGLRGHLLHSADLGLSWQILDSGAEQTLNAGLALASGELMVVGQNGQLLIGQEDQWQSHTLPGRYSLLALAEQDGELIGVGRGGIHPLPQLISQP